jgi:alpha-L-arabinofuranosidase
LREKSGKNVPLSITEYNGGFVQEKPAPYRPCLGTARLNAELLHIFMKPEHNILMANYWNFNNGYTGMVKSENDFMKHDYRKPINYIKRPNYYVFELYNNHFGEILLDVGVKCDSYTLKIGQEGALEVERLSKHVNIERHVPDLGVAHVPYLSANASKSKDGNRVYIAVVNKSLDDSITGTIDLRYFNPVEEADYWVLNGASIDATNENNPDNVKARHYKLQIKDNPFELTFEPHSLTVFEVGRRK